MFDKNNFLKIYLKRKNFIKNLGEKIILNFLTKRKFWEKNNALSLSTESFYPLTLVFRALEQKYQRQNLPKIGTKTSNNTRKNILKPFLASENQLRGVKKFLKVKTPLKKKSR